MAISDVKMTMSMDNTKVLSGLKGAQSAVQDFGASVSKEMTSKLKMALSMTAIEEATRRTGQWAQAVDQTSKSMGIANETLQLLQLLASKTGTPKDAVVGMFENIGKARDAALGGNQDMINAFARLGISMQDLRTKSKDVFVGMAADKIKALAEANGGIEKAGQQTRGAVATVTGNTPEAFINAIVKAIKEGFESTKKNAVTTGDIIPEQDVADMSATFSEIGQNFKDIMTDLTPVFAVLLSLFNTLVLALGGVVEGVQDIWKILSGLFSGDDKMMEEGVTKLGELFVNAGLAILKGLGSLFDMLVSGIMGFYVNALKNIPLIGKSLSDTMKTAREIYKETGGTAGTVSDWTKSYNDMMGTSEKTAKRGAAVGDVAAIIATGGESGVGVALEEGASVVAGAAAKVGLKQVATKAKAFENAAGKIASGEKGLLGGTTIEQKVVKFTTSRELKKLNKSGKIDELAGEAQAQVLKEINEGKLAFEEDAVKKRVAEIQGQKIADEITPIAEKAKARLDVLKAVSGVGGAAGLAGAKNTGGVVGTPSPDVTPIIAGTGQLEGTKGTGGSMLSLGGLFGTNFQSKMIKLNERMITLLANIVTNTQASRGSEFNSAGGASNIGGMAGGI